MRWSVKNLKWFLVGLLAIGTVGWTSDLEKELIIKRGNFLKQVSVLEKTLEEKKLLLSSIYNRYTELGNVFCNDYKETINFIKKLQDNMGCLKGLSFGKVFCSATDSYYVNVGGAYMNKELFCTKVVFKGGNFLNFYKAGELPSSQPETLVKTLREEKIFNIIDELYEVVRQQNIKNKVELKTNCDLNAIKSKKDDNDSKERIKLLEQNVQELATLSYLKNIPTNFSDLFVESAEVKYMFIDKNYKWD